VRFWRVIVLGVLVGAAVLVVGLVRGTDREGGDPAPVKVELVYVDVSEGSEDRLPEAREVIVEAARRARSSGTDLHVRLIDSNTASAGDVVVPFVPADAPADLEGKFLDRWLISQADQLVRRYDTFIQDTELSPKSDLLGVLVNAESYAHDPDVELSITVVSDGLNNTSEWFWEAGPLDGKGCAAIAERGVGDLRGATVRFRRAANPSLGSVRSRQVEACWRTILEEANATLPEGWFQR
jgi:hypothetical protein